MTSDPADQEGAVRPWTSPWPSGPPHRRLRLRDRHDVPQEHRAVRRLHRSRWPRRWARRRSPSWTRRTSAATSMVCGGRSGPRSASRHGIQVEYMYVDAMTMALVKSPDKFRIVACPEHVRGHPDRPAGGGHWRAGPGAWRQHQPQGHFHVRAGARFRAGHPGRARPTPSPPSWRPR